jgi:TonB family protein
MEDILHATKAGDQQTLSKLLGSLTVPVPDTWFRQVFGERLGANFAVRFASSQRGVQSSLANFFAELVQAKLTHVDVHRFERACDWNATELEYPVLAARQQSQALYAARFMDVNFSRSLWAFAYLDGGFRFLGSLELTTSSVWRAFGENPRSMAPGSSGPAQSAPLKASPDVQSAKLVHMEPPIYPEEAKRRLQQGTVQLAGIVAKDGSIQRLQVLRGTCSLAEAAVKAVNKWRYSPTLLKGEPVEVVTTIDVVFNLGR